MPTRREVMAWWVARTVIGQALVPGVFAWWVTVAPVGLSPEASTVPRVATYAGVVLLFGGLLLERRAELAARLGVGWGLVASATVTWALGPSVAMEAFDGAQALAGMIAWALFATSLASPARPTAPVATVTCEPTAKWKPRVDGVVFMLGLGLALALEIPGWRLGQRDRSLLVRAVALAGAVGLASAAGALAVSFHADAPPRAGRERRAGRLRLVAWLAAAGLLTGIGTAYEAWRTF